MNITFQSVILAGVTDVEHLKSGIRPMTRFGAGEAPGTRSNITIPWSCPQRRAADAAGI